MLFLIKFSNPSSLIQNLVTSIEESEVDNVAVFDKIDFNLSNGT